MESLHGASMVPHTWPDPAMDNRPIQTMKRITAKITMWLSMMLTTSIPIFWEDGSSPCKSILIELAQSQWQLVFTLGCFTGTDR